MTGVLGRRGEDTGVRTPRRRPREERTGDQRDAAASRGSCPAGHRQTGGREPALQTPGSDILPPGPRGNASLSLCGASLGQPRTVIQRGLGAGDQEPRRELTEAARTLGGLPLRAWRRLRALGAHLIQEATQHRQEVGVTPAVPARPLPTSQPPASARAHGRRGGI